MTKENRNKLNDAIDSLSEQEKVDLMAEMYCYLDDADKDKFLRKIECN